MTESDSNQTGQLASNSSQGTSALPPAAKKAPRPGMLAEIGRTLIGSFYELPSALRIDCGTISIRPTEPKD